VFRDINEVKVADFYSDEMGITFDKVLQNGYVDLEIPKLLLRGGVYSLDIVVQNGKIAVNQIDLLHDVFEFNVFPGDIWRSGRINRATNVAIVEAQFRE
jgi:lipopolysaccharide transport system ATP-binding protein